MKTPPTGDTGPIYWLGNIYIGKFENIFYQQCFGTHLFSRKAPQNTDLGIVKKL